jgi:FAD binding domain/Berberine and berberine like
MVQLAESDIGSLRAQFGGAVLTAADADYEEARHVWNGVIDRRPAVIARCASAKDVGAAIQFGRQRGLRLSVRGGGHNYGGYAVCDDGLMIDLSGLKQVQVDPASRRVTCGGGTTWGELDAATQAHGLAVTGGFISTTGVAGLTLGGGIGWLSRQAGLSADNLISAQMVTAEGKTVRASADENPELFWALRGGGGNFGVVTTFEFQLHGVGPMVNLGLFFWTVDQGTEALRFSRDFVRDAPDGVTPFIAGLSAPPAPFVPDQYHFARGYALVVAGFGSADEHARIVEPIRQTVPPSFELVTPMPYTQLQQLFNGAAPWGLLAYEKALYLDELSDEVISVFTDFMPRAASPLSFVPVFDLSGAYSRVAEDATAFGGSRSARYVFNIAAGCPTPELFEADRTWVRSFWDALRPYATGSGSYVNFMAEIEDDRVRAAYGASKYDRLARVKAEYDPQNLFRLNANIKPASLTTA